MAELTWEYVRTQHKQHGKRGYCAFDGCETEPCPTFRKIMPSHHYHGSDFGPGELCCGCGNTPEDVECLFNGVFIFLLSAKGVTFLTFLTNYLFLVLVTKKGVTFFGFL